MVLEIIDYANGILMIILLVMSFLVGGRLIYTYFKEKDKNYIFIGLFWIFLVCPWYPGTIAFILNVATVPTLNLQQYVILGNIFIPIAIVFWLYVFTELAAKEKQKLLIIIFSVYAVIFYAIFLTLVLINPDAIGILQGTSHIDINYLGFMQIYFITILLTLLVTGIIFARLTSKSEKPEHKFRGRFLIIAFVAYVIGTIIDAITELDGITLIMQRAFQISSIFMFYLAFVMPKWIKKRLII